MDEILPEILLDFKDVLLAPDGPVAPYITALVRAVIAHHHLFWIEARLFALALFVLYVGAHAALQRPHSAAPRQKKKGSKQAAGKKDEDDSDRDPRREGLQASDAVLLPLLAAVSLVGLYYLIQYLQDPALLNRVLRAYTSLMAVATLGRLLGDVLHVAVSVVFPNVWVTAWYEPLYRVDPRRRQQLRLAPGGNGDNDWIWQADQTRPSPFPDRVGRWLHMSPSSSPLSLPSSPSPLSSSSPAVRAAWTLRRLATTPWTVRVALLGVGRAEFGGVTLPGLLGLLLAAGLTFVYHFYGVLPSFLGNLMALGFCYGGLVLVSCTSFGIGSMVLLGLFVYDIVMVFYTPFMVTVATQIDAPIKIVASSGGRSSLLGLGDIVVPGFFICLCLRYDLYRYYARQIQHVDTVLETERAVEPAIADTTSPTTATTVTTTTTTRAVKAPYVDPQGRWGDRFWTRGAVFAPGSLDAVRFPKPYFHVAMAAYTVGLSMAIGAMLTTGQGQPALLYLVPTLVGATWGRALWAGDLKDMWAYTEDGSQDVADVVVDVAAVDAEGKAAVAAAAAEAAEENKDEEKVDEDSPTDDDDGLDVFSFSITAPGVDDMEEVVI